MDRPVYLPPGKLDAERDLAGENVRLKFSRKQRHPPADEYHRSGRDPRVGVFRLAKPRAAITERPGSALVAQSSIAAEISLPLVAIESRRAIEGRVM